MDKNRHTIAEHKDYFKHNDSCKDVNTIKNVIGKLVIQPFFCVKIPADCADTALNDCSPAASVS